MTIRQGDRVQHIPGRDHSKPDLAVGVHAYHRAQRAAYKLEGLGKTYMRGMQDECLIDLCFDELLDFALNARRYIDILNDKELAGHEITTDKKSTNFRTVLGKIIHSSFFVGRFSGEPGKSLCLLGVTLRSDEPGVFDVNFSDLTGTFLDHHFQPLQTGLDELENLERQRAIEIDAPKSQ